MKKSVILVFLVIFCVTLSFNIQTTVAQTSPSTTRVPILRLYNPNSGEHLFTMRGAEVEVLCHIGWRYEGSAWEVPKPPSADWYPNPEKYRTVYRIYNSIAGEHFYTSSLYEKNSVLKHSGWLDDGDFFWFPTVTKGGSPVYRLYNPNATVGSHHYTMSAFERDNLVKLGWRYEGVAWKAYPYPLLQD